MKEWLDLLIHFLAAAAVGSIIGIERERSHRAAGFRTHFLVGIGASIVMITGEQLANRYGVERVDPTRLAAQVVSGIGFLGAGTILKEGINVKGLTTAASLWATACLGIAAGSGLYEITIIGTLGAFLALSVLERVEKRFVRTKRSRALFEIHCIGVSQDVNQGIRALMLKHNLETIGFSISDLDNISRIELRVRAIADHETISFSDICIQLSRLEGVKKAEYFDV